MLLIATLGLAAGVELFSVGALAQVTALGEVLRDDRGNVLHMDLYQAKEACREQGSRLPTIRELAAHSQSLGARGIRETAHPGVWPLDAPVRAEIEQMDREGYSAIYLPRKEAVAFYFNYSGYQRPAGDLGNYWFWSSTPFNGHYLYYEGAYVLRGIYGGIDDHSVSSNSYGGFPHCAVRCVRSTAHP